MMSTASFWKLRCWHTPANFAPVFNAVRFLLCQKLTCQKLTKKKSMKLKSASEFAVVCQDQRSADKLAEMFPTSNLEIGQQRIIMTTWSYSCCLSRRRVPKETQQLNIGVAWIFEGGSLAMKKGISRSNVKEFFGRGHFPVNFKDFPQRGLVHIPLPPSTPMERVQSGLRHELFYPDQTGINVVEYTRLLGSFIWLNTKKMGNIDTTIDQCEEHRNQRKFLEDHDGTTRGSEQCSWKFLATTKMRFACV